MVILVVIILSSDEHIIQKENDSKTELYRGTCCQVKGEIGGYIESFSGSPNRVANYIQNNITGQSQSWTAPCHGWNSKEHQGAGET